MKKILLITCVVILAGCLTKKVVVDPFQSNVARVASKFPNYSIDQLKEGKTLYEQNCASCHGLKSVTSQSEAQWRGVVPKMVTLVNKKKPNSLDAKAEDLILKYVITMGSAK